MRKLALFAAAFAAATVLCCYAVPAHFVPGLGVLCALLGLPFIFLKGKKRTRGLLLALGVAAGFLWFAIWTAVFVTPSMVLADTTSTVTATVLDYPAKTDSGVSFDLRLEDGTAVRLYIREGYDAKPGDRLTFTAEFVRSDFMFGEKFTYYTARGVFLVAYADLEDVVLESVERTPFRFLPRVWAHHLKAGMSAVFSEEHAALLHAITLGDKGGLTDGTVSLFNRCGLSHLLVVSGLHMTILLSGLQVLLRRHKRLSSVLGGIFLVVFTFMVGCTPSAIRAALMNSLILVEPAIRREHDSPTSLGAALLVLLIQNPYAAASVSLQLSFASVAGILLITQPMQEWMMARTVYPAESKWQMVGNRVLTFLWESLSMSLGAMLFTTPLVALWFGVIAIVSPLSNILCLWASSVLLAGGLISGLVAVLSPVLAMPFAFVTALVCRYILWVSAWLGSLSFSALSLESVYYRIWFVAVYAFAGILFCYRRSWSKRPVLFVSGSVLLLCVAVTLTRITYTAPPLTVTVLDVGQGSSTAFYSEGYTMLVDCGGSGSPEAGDVAADYFQSLGISNLDLLVFTHLDDDHYNGADELFARMEIQAVALSDREDEYGRLAKVEELARQEGAEIWYITDTLNAQLGGCTVTLFPPLGSGTSNEEGLFVLCTAGSFDALITGDADSAIEAMLVKYYDIPDVELLVVGHHGSNHSTSEAFLDAVRPEYAVISVGYNSYGHPRTEVLERLDHAGAEVYRTDLQGNVTISVSGNGNIMD